MALRDDSTQRYRAGGKLKAPIRRARAAKPGLGNQGLVEPIRGQRLESSAMLRRLLTDRRAVTSFEYALLAGAIALVLFEVLQAPADALGSVLSQMFSGPGGHGGS